MSRPHRPLAALVLAALIGTGCSEAKSESAGTATSTKAGAQEQAVKFAECLRANGLSDFPDPDAKGEFRYGVSVSPAQFDKALDACKELRPPGALSAKRTPEQQTASLRFAECMRENGVKDFPDPVDGEPLVDTTKIPSSDRPGGMTILDAAMQTCRGIADEGAQGR